MPVISKPIALIVLAIILWAVPVDFAQAHHVLGRPAYSLNEDSNTPPSMQAEVQIGEYLVTYMVFPAFPKPNQPGRVNLYASRIKDGKPYQGRVTFHARADGWLSWLGIASDSVKLGTQPADDNVFRQGYMFHQAGDYIISAAFDVEGEAYVVDFPLRIGEPGPVGPGAIIAGLVITLLLGVTILQRRRSMTGKLRGAHNRKDRA